MQQHGMSRTPVESLVEYVLNGSASGREVSEQLAGMAAAVSSFNARDVRVVVLGGGTGLSTVVGGNSQSPAWGDSPFVGLKQEFSRLDVVVCTTDDGGSTGRLLARLPMIGIGDLRKSCLSLVRLENLQETYGAGEDKAKELACLIQRIFNFRFHENRHEKRFFDPLLAAPPALRGVCPKRLGKALRSLCRYITPHGRGPSIDPSGHCLGNLILSAAVFKAAEGRCDRPPGLRAIQAGLDEISALIGASPRHLHAATSTPGQLRFLYANGVEVYGQSKSARARRGFPIERCTVEFTGIPAVSAPVLRAIRSADLIIYAPGSLYSSLIPLLQLQPIVDAIRENRSALKVLGANAWIQEGETDLSLRSEGRGFLVSDLIEAYQRNVPGGTEGLFDVALSANLERVPGNILRNYALEGKSPIHLDRTRVEAMGLQPVEATLFSPEAERQTRGLHHDAGRFALAVRTLLFARKSLHSATAKLKTVPASRTPTSPSGAQPHSPLLCDYMASIRGALAGKDIRPAWLTPVLVELAWDNRDILPSHLNCLRGVRILSSAKWGRSTEWDNVLGYYDPEDRYIKLHESLISQPRRLRGDLLVALGESLLGGYIRSRRWIDDICLGDIGARCYEIGLRPPIERECFLSDPQLRTYLQLARMSSDPSDPLTFRITINNGEGFLPPGLLFGMMFAWYLDNTCSAPMDYEMAVLRQPQQSLIPHQAKERIRKQNLVGFFRTEIFGHRPAQF